MRSGVAVSSPLWKNTLWCGVRILRRSSRFVGKRILPLLAELWLALLTKLLLAKLWLGRLAKLSLSRLAIRLLRLLAKRTLPLGKLGLRCGLLISEGTRS